LHVISTVNASVILSFDTEALNKPSNNIDCSILDVEQLRPSFQPSGDKKIIFGVQAIYSIGIYEKLKNSHLLPI